VATHGCTGTLALIVDSVQQPSLCFLEPRTRAQRHRAAQEAAAGGGSSCAGRTSVWAVRLERALRLFQANMLTCDVAPDARHLHAGHAPGPPLLQGCLDVQARGTVR
jgi:hypothetical protein